jgi:hypothetical protein
LTRAHDLSTGRLIFSTLRFIHLSPLTAIHARDNGGSWHAPVTDMTPPAPFESGSVTKLDFGLRPSEYAVTFTQHVVVLRTPV